MARPALSEIAVQRIYNKEKEIKDPAADIVKALLNSPGHRENKPDLRMFETGVLFIERACVYQVP